MAYPGVLTISTGRVRMTQDKNASLTGDAKWQAERKQVADNNDAAYKRARKEREERDAVVHARRRDAERREFADLPTQPTRPS